MIFFLLFSILPLSADCATMQLPQAQKMSVQRPSLEAGRQAIVASTHSELQAQSRYMPQLTATHSSDLSNVLSVNENAHTLTLSGSQLIFDAANGPGMQKKLAALATERSTYQYDVSSQEVRYKVAINFLQVWLLEQKKTLMTAIEQYTQLLEEKNNELLKNKTINKIQWASTTTIITQQKALISTYPLERASARMALAQAIGSVQALEAPVSFDYDKPLPHKKTIEDYVALAYNYRPELKDKSTSEKQYELIAKSNRLGYLPTVSAHGSVSKTFAGAAIERGASSNIGITIQWNFFDGMQRVHAAHAADANKLRTTLEKQELKNSIALAIATTYNTLCSNEINLRAVESQADLQYELLQEAKISYANGKVDKTALAKQEMMYQNTLHEICSKKIMLHTNWQTLAWYCGYPPSGVLNEA